MDKTYFNNYKSVKEKFNYFYKGYNIKYLVPGYLGFLFAGEKPLTRDVFKEFYISTQSIDLSEVLISDQYSTLITYLIDRSDYRDLTLAAKELFENSEVINLTTLSKKNISPIGITYIKHFWIATWIVLTRSIGKGITSKLFYIALTIKILNQISVVEKTKITTIKRYVCFNSAYKEEAVLTAYFNKRNIETITLQHGVFCNFKLSIPFDIINHENLTANKLLCWGQSTIDYMQDKGMDKSRFILAGNLKYKKIDLGHINQRFGRCLVLLGRSNYIETNNKLLESLTEFNIKTDNSITFYVKKHPFLMDQDHKQYANITNNMIFLGREHSVQEVLESDLVDFSIAVNTTAYYESLALGKPCFRWTESENEDFYGMDDKFRTIEEFENLIKVSKEKDQRQILAEVKQVIQYIFNPNLTL